jgi:Lrp/AsnC family transcriptional regulator, leucine-responsive regulatory protein
MNAETASPRRKPQTALDATDRRLLGSLGLLALLAEDATRIYAELGRLPHSNICWSTFIR